VNIHGIGVVFARGRGVPALERALAEGWQPPAAGAPRLSYAVPPEALADRAAAPGLRRADRFSRLATLAAWDALRADGAPELAPARVGAIVATAFGPHVTTFKFLDDILSFGDAAVSPTTFSHSVHNAAAAYIAAALGLRGPTLTVTQFAFAFHEALRLAAAWIGEGRCDAVLVGAADEMGGVLARIAARKLRVAADGKIRPFAFAPSPATVPGEGAAFLLLSPAPSGAGFGRIADVTVGAGPRERPRPATLRSGAECRRAAPSVARRPPSCCAPSASSPPPSPTKRPAWRSAGRRRPRGSSGWFVQNGIASRGRE